MEECTTILVVDDEPVIRNSYRDFLEDLEYNVLAAENGRSGLEIFDKEDVDLVIVDLRMPEVDGLEVLQYIKENSPETPVVVISGTGVISDVVEALRCGAWDYLLKPVEDFSVLQHSVENSLERAQLRAENKKYQNELEQKVLLRTRELNDMLREKEVLLQELHHRVKNNMAVISAFISLKEHEQTDSETSNIFKDLQQRIRTMAMVHESLYHSDNFAEISLKEYCIDLCSELAGNYYAGSIPVKSTIDVDDEPLKLDYLIPIGLIINEIIINSMRHAFDGVSAPEIILELKISEDRNITLRLADNGNGFCPNPEIVNEGRIGREIVSGLVEQLQGTLELNCESGTEYIIRFPLPG